MYHTLLVPAPVWCVPLHFCHVLVMPVFASFNLAESLV